MSEKNPIPDLPADLRRRAEEVLEQQPEVLSKMQPDDFQHLIHELQVHQIELELQNEELRRTQHELEASRDRYADLYDLAPIGYFTLSEKGLILEANLTGASMLGVERVSLIKRPLTQFINRQDQDTFYMCRKQLFETQAPQVCEIRLLRNDKSQFWARIEAIPAQSSAADGIVCRATVSDVTEQLWAKQQIEAALAEKEVLLKEVYHRVTNNLQALIYLIEIHAEKVVDPELHQMFAVLVGQVTSLQQVHRRLYQSEDLVQIELGEYLEELTSNLLHALASDREISLYVDAAEHLVNANIAISCGRIVIELVTNAFKYAFPQDWTGDQEIRVSFRAREDDYLLVVSDNGVGLIPGFDLRATESMGLKLVDAWVTHHLDGSIELDGHTGTTFKINFPAPKNTS
jgi:PAS domain S-box-containing protein